MKRLKKSKRTWGKKRTSLTLRVAVRQEAMGRGKQWVGKKNRGHLNLQTELEKVMKKKIEGKNRGEQDSNRNKETLRAFLHRCFGEWQWVELISWETTIGERNSKRGEVERRRLVVKLARREGRTVPGNGRGKVTWTKTLRKFPGKKGYGGTMENFLVLRTKI